MDFVENALLPHFCVALLSRKKTDHIDMHLSVGLI